VLLQARSGRDPPALPVRAWCSFAAGLGLVPSLGPAAGGIVRRSPSCFRAALRSVLHRDRRPVYMTAGAPPGAVGAPPAADVVCAAISAAFVGGRASSAALGAEALRRLLLQGRRPRGGRLPPRFLPALAGPLLYRGSAGALWGSSRALRLDCPTPRGRPPSSFPIRKAEISEVKTS